MDFLRCILVIYIAASSLGIVSGGKVLNVVNFGAKGDGKTDNTKAFQDAWKAVCGDKEAKIALQIPPGAFLLRSVFFDGPCNSKNIRIEVLGTIVAPSSIQDWGKDCAIGSWITFRYVEALTLDGPGTLDGQGSAWWGNVPGGCIKPTGLFFHRCNNLRMNGLHLLNSGRNHMAVHDCDGVTISNIHITAPGNSPNTDGINFAIASHVNIFNSFISTGDDCISLLNDCYHFNITSVTCGPGHGISIGSLGGPGTKAIVEDVHVQHCTFNQTMNGARIKTKPGGSGYVRGVTFQDITLIGAGSPIIIDQHYPAESPSGTNEESSIAISEVRYIGVKGTSSDEKAITLDCSKRVGCKGIEMDQVNIKHWDKTKKTWAYCQNAEGKSGSTVPNVPCLKH